MAFPLVPLSAQGLTSGGSLGVSIAAAVDELKLAVASIAGVDPVGGGFVQGLQERAFQFWPTTVEDSLASGWVAKSIPGASHALMQWTSNEGRTISFELPLRRYMNYDQHGILIARADPTNSWNRPWNENVDFAIKYFRAFMYPIKKQNGMSMQAPPIAVLNFPGMALDESGADTIFTVMTQCDVSYEKGFAQKGYTKSAKLSLSFKQVIQGVDGAFDFKSIGPGGNYMPLDDTGLQRKMDTSFQLGGDSFATLSALGSPNEIKP